MPGMDFNITLGGVIGGLLVVFGGTFAPPAAATVLTAWIVGKEPTSDNMCLGMLVAAVAFFTIPLNFVASACLSWQVNVVLWDTVHYQKHDLTLYFMGGFILLFTALASYLTWRQAKPEENPTEDLRS